MKLKNKGFTMIELIAVVAILGILALIAVPSVAPYVNKSRKTSLNTMLKSTYEAAENYMIKNEIVLNPGPTGAKSIPVKDLVEDEYLQSLIDPLGNSDRNCEDDDGSVVSITRDSDSLGGLPNYTYEVTLVCPVSGTRIYTYTNDQMINDTYKAAYSRVRQSEDLQNTIKNSSGVNFYVRDLIGTEKFKSPLTGGTCKHNDSKVSISKLGNTYKYNIIIQCNDGYIGRGNFAE